jgi:hypothetical protein
MAAAKHLCAMIKEFCWLVDLRQDGRACDTHGVNLASLFAGNQRSGDLCCGDVRHGSVKRSFGSGEGSIAVQFAPISGRILNGGTKEKMGLGTIRVN